VAEGAEQEDPRKEEDESLDEDPRKEEGESLGDIKDK